MKKLKPVLSVLAMVLLVSCSEGLNTTGSSDNPRSKTIVGTWVVYASEDDLNNPKYYSSYEAIGDAEDNHIHGTVVLSTTYKWRMVENLLIKEYGDKIVHSTIEVISQDKLVETMLEKNVKYTWLRGYRF